MSKRPREEPPQPDRQNSEPDDYMSHWSTNAQNSEEASPKQQMVLKCSLPSHPDTIKFKSYEEFEVHYLKAHAHRCPECFKNFPTEHFLGLHIEENHDPLAEARRAKGEKTYHCFVEGCDKICIDPRKRKMHLVDKHMYPKKYDFAVVNTGIDGKNSMLRWKPRKPARPTKRQSPVPATDPPPMDEDTNLSSETGNTKDDSMQDQEAEASLDKDIEIVTSTMSALRFVPPSVRFGRGGKRGGLSRS